MHKHKTADDNLVVLDLRGDNEKEITGIVSRDGEFRYHGDISLLGKNWIRAYVKSIFSKS